MKYGPCVLLQLHWHQTSIINYHWYSTPKVFISHYWLWFLTIFKCISLPNNFMRSGRTVTTQEREQRGCSALGLLGRLRNWAVPFSRHRQNPDPVHCTSFHPHPEVLLLLSAPQPPTTALWIHLQLSLSFRASHLISGLHLYSPVGMEVKFSSNSKANLGFSIWLTFHNCYHQSQAYA